MTMTTVHNIAQCHEEKYGLINRKRDTQANQNDHKISPFDIPSAFLQTKMQHRLPHPP